MGARGSNGRCRSTLRSPQFERQAHHSRYERPAVREQLPAPRTRGRIRPDGRLGAFPETARPPLSVRLRERCARHADNAARRAGRHPARRARQPRHCRARPRLYDLPHQRRQLLDDALAGKRGAHRGDLSPARGRRVHRAANDQAGLRRAAADVLAGPLRQGHLPEPELRRAGPVRRLVRGLRHHLFAARSQGCRVDGFRHETHRARVGAPFLEAQRLRGGAP